MIKFERKEIKLDAGIRPIVRYFIISMYEPHDTIIKDDNEKLFG